MPQTLTRKTTKKSTRSRRASKKAPAAKRTRASKRATLSASHKKALAEGRSLSSAVDRYMRAISTPKKRGRQVSVATMKKRLDEKRALVRNASGVDLVLAIQAARDLEVRIAHEMGASNGTHLKALEAEFVKVAKRFGENRNISYAAWRDAGVPPAVLQRAGITRTRTSR